MLPQDYRDLVEVAEDAGQPLRAARIAAAAGLSTDRGKVETLRGAASSSCWPSSTWT